MKGTAGHVSHAIVSVSFVFILSGKTTLLVSVICRYFMESGENHRRLMVCAPTNKAVAVLAARFAASVNPDTCNCNAIMVGDVEKLLVDERSSSKGQQADDSMQLRSMFIFSWMQTLMEDYRKIRNYFVPMQQGRNTTDTRKWTKEDVWKSASRLEKRLGNSLPDVPEHISKKAALVTGALQKLAAGTAAHGIVEHLDKLLKALKEVPPDLVWRELLHSADVVFCTLASSGGLIFKNTAGMDDLIVDGTLCVMSFCGVIGSCCHTRSHPIPAYLLSQHIQRPRLRPSPSFASLFSSDPNERFLLEIHCSYQLRS
jgi:hypothetical protein